MSFSSEVKEELSRHLGKSRHCQIAELAALIAFDGKVQVSESGCDLFLDSENELLNTKYDLLLKKLFDFPEGKSGREQKRIYETVFGKWSCSKRCAGIIRTLRCKGILPLCYADVYIYVPQAELKNRLCGRQTDGAETIALRLRNAEQEDACLPQYRYCLVSSDRETDYASFCALLKCQSMRVGLMR